MSLIKLSNTTIDHQGDLIYINPNWIVTVFPIESDTGWGLKTIVFGGPKGTAWEVEESPEKIKKMVNKK